MFCFVNQGLHAVNLSIGYLQGEVNGRSGILYQGGVEVSLVGVDADAYVGGGLQTVTVKISVTGFS